MKDNRFKRVLAEGRVPVGHMILEFGTRGLAMMTKAADLDFVLLDMEHTGFDMERMGDLAAFFKATDVAPFVRVPQPVYHFMARLMDAGMLGIMVGNVETPEVAKSIVDAVTFEPIVLVAAVKCIIAVIAAFEVLEAGASRQQVTCTAATEQVVVTVATDDRIDTETAIGQVIAIAAIDGVVATVAEQLIMARVAVDPIVALAAANDILPVAAA